MCLNESFSSFHEPGGDNNYFQLDCERGGVTITRDGTIRVSVQGEDPFEIPVTAVDKPESDFLMLNDLLEGAEKGSDSQTSADDNLKTVRFLEAAYQSAASGEVVKVDDLEETCVCVKPGVEAQLINTKSWGVYHKEPGQEHSKVHFHDCDEWYLIVEGTGTIRIGDIETDVGPPDLLHVPAGVLHGTLRSEGSYKLVFMESPPRGAERTGHLVPGVDDPFVELPGYLKNGSYP